ncbi:MAG: hypothetical protein LC635_04055 [Pseudonocardiaceae bacterium]|nr:hypothetical protein [Pseudonocardiaceae bacterium]
MHVRHTHAESCHSSGSTSAFRKAYSGHAQVLSPPDRARRGRARDRGGGRGLRRTTDHLGRRSNDHGRARSISDDDIASSLWVKGGRPDIVTRTAALIGLTGTEPPENPGRWGEVKLTPHDLVRVYQYVMSKLSPADHTLIVDALAQAPQYAADAFDQHFGIPDGLNTQWAIKQGWGNNSATMVLHSTGLVGANWRYVLILLTEHPNGSGWRTSADSVTAAAGTLNGQLPDA